MKNPPYPVIGEPVKPSWHDRRSYFKILLGAGILALLLVAFGIPAFVASRAALRQHPIYKEALSRAISNPRVVDVLGEPVQSGWLFSGSAESRNQFGYADFEIPLEGPKGDGELIVRTLQLHGTWEFRRLRLEVKGIPDIDLLAEEPAK